MLRLILFLFPICLLWACQPPEQALQPKTGIWRASLDLGEANLPVNFELSHTDTDWHVTFINGKERLQTESVEVRDDSVFIQMAVFDSRFVAALTDTAHMRGYWQDFSRGPDYRIPFVATAGEVSRFAIHNSAPPTQLAGRWETTFSQGSTDEAYPEYPAVAVFQQEIRRLVGTFLTETGDYRFLQGAVDGDSLKLSAFDGSHAFLFLADLSSDTLHGVFYSGNHWKEPWIAIRNPKASLRSPDSLTFLNPGYESLAFTFPNLAGEEISLSDRRYQGKAIIVQLMGSWCPNCMDESKLFSRFYQQYQGQGLEIIALAFERGSNPEMAQRNLSRLRDRFGIGYELLLADFTGEKDAAMKALPMINHVMAFPTAFFIDRNGSIRKNPYGLLRSRYRRTL